MAFSLAVLMTLAGCGGGGGGSPSATLSGTAAIGKPIVGGTVQVVCAGGGSLTSQPTTSQGAWSVTLSGQTLPCAVEVSGGNLPAGTTYHAVVLDPGIVNITPFTDLIVANMAATDPASWFNALDGSTLQQVTAAGIASARSALRAALGNPAALDGVDPMTASFLADGVDILDVLLDAFFNALTTAGIGYPDFLAEAAKGNPTITTPANFATIFENELASLTGGSPGGGGSSGVSAPLSPASQYAIGYAGTLCQYSALCDIGLDIRMASLTLGSSGEMTAYAANADEAPTLGSASVSDLGGNADVTWGRWNGGQLAGKFYSVDYTTTALLSTQGFHYVAGNNTATLPTTGTATYHAIAATSPTSSGNGANSPIASVDLANSSAAIDFASGKVGFDVTFAYALTSSTTTFRLNSAGGSGNVAASAFSLQTFAGANAVYPSSGSAVEVTVNGTSAPSYSVDTYAYLIPYGADAHYLALIFHDHNYNAGVVIFEKM